MAVGETSGQGPQRRVVSAGGGRRRPAGEATRSTARPTTSWKRRLSLVKEADPELERLLARKRKRSEAPQPARVSTTRQPKFHGGDSED